jgi:threonyl-tRNA synthetase
LNLLRDYGLNEFYLELSTKNEEKFVGEDADWAEATEALRKAATAQNLELVLDEGGAAFYGPKISVQAKDAIGRTWQMSTIQVDFQLPQRFELEYSATDGTRQRPVMIHRALFGSIERFFGVRSTTAERSHLGWRQSKLLVFPLLTLFLIIWAKSSKPCAKQVFVLS